MDHYLEIRILPDPEFVPTLLMSAIYSKLHRALVHLGRTDIGVSFPHYDPKSPTLGSRLRLHSSDRHLETLMNTSWLTGMHDHIRAGNISKIPDEIQYAVFRRVQAKSSAERIRRRQMRRHGLSYEKVQELIPDTFEKRLRLPFVNMKSHSTDQPFKLFIRQENSSSRVQGHFNAYGLSTEATVPLF